MNIGVIFGSRTPEHDVSIASAYALMSAITKHTGHTVVPIYITREGKRIVDQRLRDIRAFRQIDNFSQTTLPRLQCKDNDQCMLISVSKDGFFSKSSQQSIDIIRNMCHGANGEDGAISGLAQLLNLPIIAPGIFAESIALNKYTMKQRFDLHKLPHVPYLYSDNSDDDIASMIADAGMTYPVYIKPANLGSTIGISRVASPDELDQAVEVARHFDHEIVVEQGVKSPREFNCSVMEQGGSVITSLVEEPQASDEYLTFEDKYTSEDGATMKGAKSSVQCPANISDELTHQIRDMTAQIYRLMRVQGGAPRIDYLYDEGADQLYVNEINMIPGSMQLPLWHASGMPIDEFIQSLIETAKRMHRTSQKNITYNSTIIEHTISVIEQLGKE